MSSVAADGVVHPDESADSTGAATTAEPVDKPAEPPADKPSKSALKAIAELVLIVAVALGLAFGIQAFLVKPYKIPSGSMEPTLAIGQRVLVNRVGMELGHPSVGEIVVFHPPQAAEQMVCGPEPHRVTPGGAACSAPMAKEGSVNYIKRIVAGPGDEVYVKEGHVYREAAGSKVFVRENDPYIKATCEGSDAPAECNFPVPITIPAGHWFMMGDNRGDSDDSRFWGPVPTGWIIGEAFFTYWPPDRIGGL
jgi:signal peptidase I